MVEDKSMDNTAGLLQINNLSYQLKPDLSMCVSRAATTQFFAMQEYSPGSSMICIFNTGSSFVYGPRTYLSLDIKNTSEGGTWTFGNGTAANLIARITVSSRHTHTCTHSHTLAHNTSHFLGVVQSWNVLKSRTYYRSSNYILCQLVI